MIARKSVKKVKSGCMLLHIYLKATALDTSCGVSLKR